MKTEGMKFPVDLLAHVSQEELERSAQNYMNTLLYSNPDFPESITLSDSTKVIINISTVGFVPLYGSSDKQKILALFTGPTDPFTAVALYLLNRWWTISDILKTEDNDRDGAVEVQTVGERIVLYSLNRVIYRAKEMSSEELPFLCHGETDYAKILWHNGEAVGFYSVKPSGSLCSSFSTRSYQLPVMDSIFVRKCHRGNGYGLQMLKDYVLSFNDSCLGLRYPLTTAMYKVCQKYLSQYPGDADLLWEVQSIGGPNQRTNIANKIQVMDLSAVSKRLLYTEEPGVIMEEREKDTITTMIKEADSVKSTAEILEEVTVVKGKGADEVPLAAWDRNNGSKQWKIGENITEDKTEKVIRIEDIEAESPGEEQVSEQQITEEHNISEQVHSEDILSVATEGKTEVEYGEDSASMLDKTTTVQASEDLESESTVAPAAEEHQVEDKDLCGPNALYDSQIAIENVVSEIEEAQKKDSTVVSTEVLDVCKQPEMVEMRQGAKNDASEEELAEIFIQQVKGQSTHATSAKEKAEKRGQAVIKTAHSEPPQLRSHRKAEEDGGRVLRGRTVVGSLASKCKSTQRSQKAREKLETEFSFTHEVDELSGTEGQYGRDPTAVPEMDDIVTEINKTDQQQKNEEAERSLIQDEAKESDEEKEPPVIQRRALRARSKATPPRKSTRHSKRHQKQQNEHTDDLESQESLREDKIEQQVQEDQMEKEDTINKPQKDIPAIEINDVENKLEATLSTEENMEECKKVQEEGKTQEVADTEAVGEEEKEEMEAGIVIADMTEKHDSIANALIADEVQNLPSVVSADTTEEPSKKNAGNSEIPKLHKAAVMLVDIKTACHHLQVKSAEEIQATKVSTAVEKEEIILTTAGASKKENPTSVVEQKELEPQQVGKVVEKEEVREGVSGKDMENAREFEEKQCLLSETSAEKEEDCTVQNAQQSIPFANDNEGMSLDKEEVPLVQTRGLRSGTITIIDKARHNIIRKTEDTEHSETEKTERKTEGKAKEETMDGGEMCLEPVVELWQEKGVADEANLEQNIAEQQSEAITEKVADKIVDVSGEVLQDGADVGEKTMTASEKEENAVDLTTAAEDSKAGVPEYQNETAADSTLVKTNEDEKILTVEEQQSEIVALQLADLPRLSVVLVDLKKSQHGVQAEADAELAQEETTVEISVPSSFAVISKEVSVVKTQDLRDGKTAKAIHDDEDMEEEKTTEEDVPAKETRLLRGGRKSTSATPRCESKRACTQPQTEEKSETEEAEVSEYIQIKETQDNQGGKMPEKEEFESTTQKEDDKESEADMETVDDIVEESVSEQGASKATVTDTDESLDNIQTTDTVEGTDEEAPAAETIVLENDRKTMKATKDEEEDEEKDTQEGKSVIETRVLRSGKKCAATISRHISKRTCTQSETEEDDVEEGTPPTEKIEQEEAISKEAQDNQEEKIEDNQKADPATQKDDNKESQTEVEKEAVAEESLTETGTVEETPAIQSVEDLPTTEQAKTIDKDNIPDTEEPNSTEEDEPAKETRVLRGGRKSASTTPRHKSKRAHKQPRTEKKEKRGSTASTVEIQVEETNTGKKQDREEKMEETADTTILKEDNRESQSEVEKAKTVWEESLAEQGRVEDPSAESLEDLPTTDEGNITHEEDTPVVETRILRRGQKTVKGTQDEQDIQKDKSTEDEPTIQTRALRGGRKSISTTPRRKSKRARTQPQTEEKEETKGAALSEYIQIEEVIAEEIQDNQEEKIEEKEENEFTTEKEDNKESETEVVKEEAVAEESHSKQDAAVEETPAAQHLEALPEETKDTYEEDISVIETRVLRSGQKTVKATQDDQDTEEDKSTEDESAKETRVLRHGRKSAFATPRRKSKRARKQPETEEDEDEVDEDITPTKKTQPKGTISKEKQDNQEEKTEGSEKADSATQEEDTKETEIEIQKQAVVAEELLPEQGPVEETPAIQSVEALPSTQEAKTTDEEDISVLAIRVLRSGQQKVKATQDDQDTEEDKSTEENEPVKETRVLRGRRKSASATPRRKSKRVRTQPQTEEMEEREHTASAEEMQVEEISTGETQDNQEEKMAEKEEIESTAQKEDDKESEADVETVENIVEESVSEQGASKDTVAEESLDNIQTTDMVQATDEVQAAETTILENDQKTMKATQDEEEEEEKDTEEGKPVIETRVLRSGKKCAATVPRHISKRTCTQSQREEDDVEEGTPPTEKIELEEAISKETQDNEEEMIEDGQKADPATQKDDNKESETEVEKEAVAEESLPETGTVEETPAIQSVEDLPSTQEAKTTDKEDISVLARRVLRNGQKTVKATQDDQDTEEGKSTEEDEPVKETRVLRGGRKSASATPRSKSKRVHTQPQTEEMEEREHTASAEEMQVEEISGGETQDSQEEKMERKEDTESTAQKEDKDSEAEMETVKNIVEESVPEQGASKDTVANESLDNVQNTDTVQATDEEAPATETIVLENDQKTMKATQDEEEEEEKDTEEGKPVIETRVLRSGKKCAATISRHISKRTCTQSQTEEDDVEEGTPPTEKIQLEEAISKETQDNQEEMIEDSQNADPATQKDDNKESETEMEKEAVAEESLPETGTVEETPAIQSAVDLPSTQEAKTTDEEDISVLARRVLRSGQKTIKATQDDQDTEEDKSTEEDEPAKETRVLRGRRKSASATPRRKSKRVRTQPQTEEMEEREHTASAEEMQVEEISTGETQDNQEEKMAEKEEIESTAQKEDDKESEADVETVENIVEEFVPEQGASTVANESLDNVQNTDTVQATDEEAPATETIVLENDQKTMKATQDEEEEEEKDTEEGKPVIETRVLRSGKKCAATVPRHISKRTYTQSQTEENYVEEGTPPTEKIQLEEGISKETQDNEKEMIENSEKADPATQKEDSKESETEVEKEAVAEESLPEKGTVRETLAIQSVEDLPSTQEAKTTDKEDIPVLARSVLRNGQKTVKATQDDQDTEEDKSIEEDEPVKETRVLRGGRKSASVTPRRKPKRTRKHLLTEEKEVREEAAPSEYIQTIAEETQGNQEEKTEDRLKDETEEDDIEEGTPPIEKVQLEEAISKDTQDNLEEMIEDSEKADATTQKEDNKESETEVEKEAVAEKSLPEPGTVEETPATQIVEDLPTTEKAKTIDKENIPDTEKDKGAEEDEPAKETRVVRGGRKSVSTTPRCKSKTAYKQPQAEEKEETEEAAPSEYIQIEEIIAEETQDNQEEKTEDGLKDETKIQKEDDRELETEEAVAKSIPKKDQIEEREDETNGEERILIKMIDMETSSEKGDGLNLELDTDEEAETASLNQEEEDKQSMSEEDEQIVIREKVLRGRSVPSIIITPKYRRHSTKVQKAQESSSDEDPEHNPKRKQSAKRSSQKRQSSEITPNRRSKRHKI